MIEVFPFSSNYIGRHWLRKPVINVNSSEIQLAGL